MVAHRESAVLAERLIGETCARQGITPGELTLHADRGSSMTSKPVALLLTDLAVTKTHSRPHVSNDNPFSEAQFKTLKYRPEFPDRFGAIVEARGFCQRFFLVQHRASPHGPRLAHAGRRPLRPRGGARGRARRGARRRSRGGWGTPRTNRSGRAASENIAQEQPGCGRDAFDAV
jgi:transposase InsO family protein